MSNIYTKWCSCSRIFLAIVCTFSYELTRFLIVKGSCFLLSSLAFNILEVVSSLCLTRTSSADDVIGSRCYWYVELSKAVSFFEADDICASNGGRLAPFVDSWQYSIIENMRPYTT